MIEYKVVNAIRPDRFEGEVIKLLNEGWRLHGSPFVAQTGGMTQALTRSVETAEKKERKKTGAKDAS